MLKISNILTAVDYGNNDSLLLDYSRQLALKFGSKIWLIHISPPTENIPGGAAQYVRNIRTENLSTEQKKLKQYSAQLETEGIPSEGLLIQGPTVEMILAEASILKVDLFIMGIHQHNFFYRLFKEDTADSVIKKAHIPILTVPLN